MQLLQVFGLLMAAMVLAGFISLIGILFGFVSLPFHAVDAGINTAHGVIDDTLNADNAIYNYEWFKQQVQDIEALEQKVAIAEQAILTFELSAGERSTWTFEDKTEDSRLRAVAQGLRSQYTTAITDYNARASMATRSIFEDGLIPSVLEAAASIID